MAHHVGWCFPLPYLAVLRRPPLPSCFRPFGGIGLDKCWWRLLPLQLGEPLLGCHELRGHVRNLLQHRGTLSLDFLPFIQDHWDHIS